MSFFLNGMVPAKRENILVTIGESVQVDVILQPTSINTSILFGNVTDENGVALEGVNVILKSETIPELQTLTMENGAYQFENLPPGKYVLVFRKKGYQEVKRNQIDLASGAKLQVNVELVQKTVTAKSQVSVKKTPSPFTWTYTADDLKYLPMSNSIYALLDHTPGVDSNTISTVFSDPSTVFNKPEHYFFRDTSYATVVSRGGDFYSTIWNYDGLNITPFDSDRSGFDLAGDFPSFFDLDEAEQVQIITASNDVSIPYGGTTINIVSKRGGTKWHGDASYFFSDDSLQSENTPQEMNNPEYDRPSFTNRPRASATNRIRSLQQYGFSLGGSAIPDRLFIWGAYQQGWLETINIDNDFEENQSMSVILKANWNLNAAHQLQFDYFKTNHEFITNYYNGQFFKVLHEPATILPGLWKGEYDWLFDSYTTFRARYGYVGAGLGYGGIHHPLRNQINGHQEQAVHDIILEVNRFAESFLGGDHDLRFGFESRLSNIRYDFFATPEIFNTPYTDQPTFGEITGWYPEMPRETKINRTSFYASDSYRKGKLTLNLGFRYDRQSGKNEPVVQPSPFMFADNLDFLGPGFEAVLPELRYPGRDPGITFDNFSPRGGATYDLLGNSRIVPFANFARYYQPYYPQLLEWTAPSSGGLRPILPFFAISYHDRNDDHIITIDEIEFVGHENFTDLLTRRLYEPDLANSFVDEWIVGAQTQVNDALFFSAAFTHRSYHNFQVGVPHGLSLENFYQISTLNAQTRIGDFLIPIFGLSDYIGSDLAFLHTNRNYTQTYDGFEFSFRTAITDNFSLRGGLVVQSQKQHNLSNDFPSWFFAPTSILLADPQFNYRVLENHRYGRTSDWQIKWSGVYHFPWDITLGGFIRYQKGILDQLLGLIDSTGLRDFGAGIYYVDPHPSDKLDNLFTLDLRLNKGIDLQSYGHLDFSVESSNVTNSNAVLFRGKNLGGIANGTFLPNPYVNGIRHFQSPRVFRLGLRYSY